MLFGYFKTIYFENFEQFWEYLQNHFKEATTITRYDIGLLTYGSKHSQRRVQDPSFPLLRNAVEEGFSLVRTQHAWGAKLGLYPIFNRAALSDKNIRHEAIVADDGNADTEADPEAAYLKAMNELNADAEGYNGSLFRLTLPSFQSSKRKQAMTQPRSKERQEAIMSAKTGSGKLFARTGGIALNDDDVLISMERKRLQDKLEELAADKAKWQEAEAREGAAFAVIEAETADYKSPELKILIAWKLGKPCPSKYSSKADRLALWLEVKSFPPPQYEKWTDEDEIALKAIEEKIGSSITLEDTEYGRALEDERCKARSILLAMPTPERNAFLGGDDDDTTSQTDDSTERSVAGVTS